MPGALEPPQWRWRLITAPLEDANTTQPLPGAVEYRTIWPGWGSVYHDMLEIDLGGSLVDVRQDPTTTILQAVPGGGSTVRIDRPKTTIVLAADAIDGDRWADIVRLHESRRLVMLSPDYDQGTYWASNFGAAEESAGVALVGNNLADQLLSSGEFSWGPSPWSGYGALLEEQNRADGKKVPHLGPGLVGKAIHLNRATENLLTGSPGWVMDTGTGDAQAMPGASNIPSGAYGINLRAQAGLASARVDQTPAVASSGQYSFFVDLLIYPVFTGATVTLLMEFPTVTVEREIPVQPGWHRYWLRGTNSATAGNCTLKIRNDNPYEFLQMMTGAMMFQQGAHPTDFLDYGKSSTNGDAINPAESILRGAAGITFLFWFWWPGEPASGGAAGRRYLVSYRNLASEERYIYLDGTNLDINLWGSTPLTVPLNTELVAEEWNQVAVTIGYEAGTSTTRNLAIYCNGVFIGHAGGSSTTEIPRTDASGLFFGSSRGNPSVTPHAAADMPLDMVRVDQRAWETEEVLADYQMRADPGLRGLLSQVQGKKFLISSLPPGFRAWDTSQVVGPVTLTEAGYIEAALA